MADYRIAGVDELQLHHFYRATAWLGEKIAPIAAGAPVPRCIISSEALVAGDVKQQAGRVRRQITVTGLGR